MHNVLDWLEDKADRIPDKVAVEDLFTSLTFRQLQQASQRTGTWFAKRIAPRKAVGFFMEKSAGALAAMFGVVYAGAYYATIDIRQPAKRILSICDSLKPEIILYDKASEEAARGAFRETSWKLVPLEEVFSEDVDERLLAARTAQASDIDPLYITFTSGSTGVPKGVVAPQRAVLDFIPAFAGAMHISQEDIAGNQAPFDFDGSVKDIYTMLYVGSTVELIPRSFFIEPTKLMDYLCERQVTTLIWAVGAMSFVSIMNAFDYRVPTTVNKVGFSGEVMPPKQLKKWRKYLPNATFVNLYGPTETTCNCTYFVVDREYDKGETIPAGKPFPNEKVFLLDEENHEVTEPNKEGEVCVSGTTLSLGYLNNPDRTAAVFIQNPINHSWQERIYRTGDLAFWNEEGNLVYASRKDNQVKHMGERIELGEIESAARRARGVENACCLYDFKRKRIHLFYSGSAKKDELLPRLREMLPQYMIPNATMQLDALPLNNRGKIDREKLKELGNIEC